MDLAEWVSARRYAALLELIDQLPSNSRYYEAVVNHPEYADQIASMPEPEDPWSPRQSEFGLNEHLLTLISDQLQQLTNVTIKANNGKPGELKPQPRPRSAIDEARERAELEWAKDFIQRLGFDENDI